MDPLFFSADLSTILVAIPTGEKTSLAELVLSLVFRIPDFASNEFIISLLTTLAKSDTEGQVVTVWHAWVKHEKERVLPSSGRYVPPLVFQFSRFSILNAVLWFSQRFHYPHRGLPGSPPSPSSSRHTRLRHFYSPKLADPWVFTRPSL